ncbi:tyrosine-type recombinase/integrase [Motilimonas pumila]|uniref:Integrase n=1 Tax=Motilimonas pumila TaxID=2303987 RepID=A0A418Y9K3_9GAMM|nr:tyrosine-type recombinase/integrase [Motilimonas pumila]RJG37757.1 hypothetical protein D1Z90_19585 [Motilimonas pumila]
MANLMHIPSHTLIESLGVSEQFSQYVSLASEALSENTQIAYRGDWQQLGQYLYHQAISLPMSVEQAIEFLDYLAQLNYKSATITRKTASLSVLHDSCGYTQSLNPTTHQAFKLKLKGIKKRFGVAQQQATPLRIKHLELLEYLYTQAPITVAQVRDLLILNLAFDAMLRRQELVNIEVGHIQYAETGEGGTLYIPFSKTDQEGEGTYVWLSSKCMHYYQTWLTMTGVSQGQLLRKLTKHGKISKHSKVTDTTIYRTFKRVGQLLSTEQEILNFSGHSGRVGAAVELTKAKTSLAEIQNTGRWKSPVMPARYSRQLQAEQSAMAKLRP